MIGDDFVTEIGVSVSQDDFESLIGRLGVRAGFNFPNDRGTVYARASVLHDFKGEMSSRLDYAGKSRVVEDDLGGTWYEAVGSKREPAEYGWHFKLTDELFVEPQAEVT